MIKISEEMETHIENFLFWKSRKLSKYHESRIWMKSDVYVLIYVDFCQKIVEHLDGQQIYIQHVM